MTAGTKECMACHELIHEKAQKCPHCYHIQSKLHTIVQFNNLTSVVLIVGLLAFFYLLTTLGKTAGRPEGDETLTVESAVLYTRDALGKEYVSCSGTIKNGTGRDAADVDLRADFYNETDQLIDTFAVRTNLRVNSGERTNYRVRGEADKPLAEYRKCKVVVVDQWFK